MRGNGEYVKRVSILTIIISLISTIVFSAEVNVFSARHYDSDIQLYEKFTAKTGIKVNVIKANADELIERMKNEGENSPADLFITVDVGKLFQASEMGLLQKITIPSLSEKVSKDLICLLYTSPSPRDRG